MASSSPVQKEKIDLAMSRLEKLRREIASIESKYGIFEGQYSSICDEALAIINEERAKLQHGDSIDETPAEIDSASSCVKTEPANSSPTEDIHNHYGYDFSRNEHLSLPPPSKIPVIDSVADAIELGLDKLGDALIYPFDAILRLQKKVIQANPYKKREAVK